jgi:quinol monooxygenase YgiN
MHIVVVSIHVKPGKAGEFAALTGKNIRETLKESGVVRFDVLQQDGDPNRFVLFEVYRNPGDHAAHKLSAHYRAWNLASEPLMAEPRTRTIYTSVFPAESGWE